MLSVEERSTLAGINKIATRYNVPFEDTLFIDFNRKGIVQDKIKSKRVRFYFDLSQDLPYLKESKENGIMEYFFACPTESGISNYQLFQGELYLNGNEKIGNIRNLVDDTVDTVYPRKKGLVMNINPSFKSSCSGCSFCPVPMLTPNDREDAGKDKRSLIQDNIEKWLRRYGKKDLSYLHRVDVVTGSFGGEEKAIENLSLMRDTLSKYDYNGEIFYLGSEIKTSEGLDSLKKIKPFAYCLTIETFKMRGGILRPHKAENTLEHTKKILNKSKNNGFGTHFTYVLGLEPLDVVTEGMREFSQVVNRLPVINIFQPHDNFQLSLRTPEADNLEYFLNARKSIEGMFNSDDFRPRTWGNYRSLWYLKYGDVTLGGERVPE